MKILFTVNHPSPYRTHFFNELGKLCDLTVLFEEDPSQQSDRHEEWYYSNYEHFDAVFLNESKSFINKICRFNIKNYLTSRFDIIIVGNYSTLTGMYAINYMNNNNIKFAIEADGAIRGDGKGLKEKLKKKLISSANWWFSTSNMTDKYFEFYGASPENIYRYPFTSLMKEDISKKPVTKKEKTAIKQVLGIKYEKVVLAVGRFIYSKGFDVLIEATQHLSEDIGVYIVGGEVSKEYMKQIKSMNLNNIHFITFKPKEELKKYYKASDLFVLPTRGDAWGLVINEAMASGLPVITTDQCVAGIELIEDEKNGYVVKVEDSIKLREKIVKILNDEYLMGDMATANVKKIQEYTIEKMAVRHKEIFTEIINN